jgi:hypothetical protein
MSRDDTTTLDRTGTGTVPVPRSDREVLWAEPMRLTRSSRPLSEYWDVENARWTTRPSLPTPRHGE